MRSYNFYPGPAALPASVLEAFRDEMLEYRDAGASFIELSHRSKEVLECHERIVAAVRSLLGVDERYHVLLLHGSAIGQYAAVPLNLAGAGETAAMAVTGHWSKVAAKEMGKYCDLQVCADTGPDYRTLPAGLHVPQKARYLAYVDNETIHGVEFPSPPDAGDVPLVVDQSSNIFSRPFAMEKVGVLFACLQKNLGPSGLALVVVREDLCAKPQATVPRIWDYGLQAGSESMANTPATFQFRMLELMLDWLAGQGGLAELDARNVAKSALLYDYIDGSGYYVNNVDPACRSRMNVPFRLPDESLDGAFVSQAKERGLLGIKGHRSVGGMRASIYNAMPVEGVQALVDFMREFSSANG